MIHLYGNFELPGSFREVSEGMEMAVRATGRLSNKTAHDRAEVGGFRTRVEEGSVALICGWPMALRTVCMVPQHRSRWLLLAPNSFGIPEDLKKFLLAEHLEGRRLTGFLAPSLWACDVLRGLGLPVVHAPHGVEPSIMRPAPRDLTHAQDALFDRGHFNVAHVTSSNKRRKGTLELLEAWRTFALEEPGAKLVLYGNASFLADYQRMIRRSGARNVTLVANTNNPKSTIVRPVSLCAPDRSALPGRGIWSGSARVTCLRDAGAGHCVLWSRGLPGRRDPWSGRGSAWAHPSVR